MYVAKPTVVITQQSDSVENETDEQHVGVSYSLYDRTGHNE